MRPRRQRGVRHGPDGPAAPRTDRTVAPTSTRVMEALLGPHLPGCSSWPARVGPRRSHLAR